GAGLSACFFQKRSVRVLHKHSTFRRWRPALRPFQNRLVLERLRFQRLHFRVRCNSWRKSAGREQSDQMFETRNASSSFDGGITTTASGTKLVCSTAGIIEAAPPCLSASVFIRANRPLIYSTKNQLSKCPRMTVLGLWDRS